MMGKTVAEATLLSKEAADAYGRPRRDATAAEVRIFSPDRASQGKCCGKNRPVFGITCAEPLPSFCFEVGVEILADDRAKCRHPF